jgi:hypothetical protein
VLFTKTWSFAKATQKQAAAATTKITTTTTTRVIDDCVVVSNFRMISVSSFVFQMKRLVERTVWLSLSTPLTSLS